MNLKQNLFEDYTPLLAKLRVLLRFQTASTEFQLVLEDLFQVIKLIYDIDPDK